jgi:RNA polymerase sigma-70 factor (ECF subfamily)
MTDWEWIVSQNARNVFRVAFRMLGSEHDAEDVTQDVFCEAVALVDSREVRDWPGLLRRMAALRSIDRLRRRVPMVAIDVNASVNADPSSEAVAKELAERLRDAIAQLSDQQAAVFSLAYFESLSRDEIANSLGITTASVSTALYKARQKLKSLLVETTQEISDG